METYTVILEDSATLGGGIAGTLFGANILFNRDNIDDVNGVPGTGGTYDDVVEELGVTTIRYPGGAMSEWTFDLEDPNTPLHNYGGLDRFQPHGSNVDHLGLSEFIEYCGNAGLSMTFVMPTIRFLGGPENVDAQGNRYEGIRQDDVKLIEEFITSLLEESLERDVPLLAIELGNEWYTDFTDLIGTSVSPVEYGRVASRMAMVIQKVIDDFHATHDLPATWEEPKLIVQLGHSVKDPVTGEELYSETEATQAIFREFNLDAEQRALDGALVHRYDVGTYDLIEAMANRNFSQFSVWDALTSADADFGEMSRFVTEWNISGNTTNTRGLECAAAMLELFTHMVRSEVDLANIWAVQQNNVSNLSGDEGSRQLRLTGELFSLMSDSLIGLNLLNVESGSDIYEITAFGNEGRIVIYVSSRSEAPITLRLDANSLVGDYTHVAGVTLGVAEGSDPLHPASQPELTHLTDVAVQDGDYITVVLDPYEITQLSFTLDGSGVTLAGHSGNDELFGGAASDLISGRDGHDTISARDGDDIIDGGSGDDTIYAGNGNDQVQAGAGNDLVQLGSGADVAYGDAGNDRLYGLRNDDILFGGDGDDILDGGLNNDILHDGSGSDIMIGGAGSDGFVLSPTLGAIDIIADYEVGLDWIDVSAWGVTAYAQLRFETFYADGLWSTTLESGSNSVTLQGLAAPTGLSAADFVFADLSQVWCSTVGLGSSVTLQNPKGAPGGLYGESKVAFSPVAREDMFEFDFGADGGEEALTTLGVEEFGSQMWTSAYGASSLPTGTNLFSSVIQSLLSNSDGFDPPGWQEHSDRWLHTSDHLLDFF